MPTELDIKMLPKVLAVIVRVGVPVVLSENSGTYDAATSAVTGAVVTHVVLKASPLLDYDTRLIDGDLIQRGDTYMYLAGKDLGFVPKVGWSVTTDAVKTWLIVTVRDLRSGEQTAAWELQLRR